MGRLGQASAGLASPARTPLSTIWSSTCAQTGRLKVIRQRH